MQSVFEFCQSVRIHFFAWILSFCTCRVDYFVYLFRFFLSLLAAASYRIRIVRCSFAIYATFFQYLTRWSHIFRNSHSVFFSSLYSFISYKNVNNFLFISFENLMYSTVSDHITSTMRESLPVETEVSRTAQMGWYWMSVLYVV